MRLTVLVSVCALGIGPVQAEDQQWSFKLNLGLANADLDIADAGAPSIDGGVAYGFAAERLGRRFGWGIETANSRHDVAGGGDTLHIDRYMLNALALVPLSDRTKLSASVGIGAVRNNLEFDPDGDQWGAGAQIRAGVEREVSARNWIGVQATGWTSTEEDGQFGAGDSQFRLSGADLSFTYRRTY